MKRAFAVVTDSTADLPDSWRERYGIEVVPLKVLFRTYRGEEVVRTLPIENGSVRGGCPFASLIQFPDQA